MVGRGIHKMLTMMWNGVRGRMGGWPDVCGRERLNVVHDKRRLE
jgi:hypothetical protein